MKIDNTKDTIEIAKYDIGKKPFVNIFFYLFGNITMPFPSNESKIKSSNLHVCTFSIMNEKTWIDILVFIFGSDNL